MKKPKTHKVILRLIKLNGINLPFLREGSKPDNDLYDKVLSEIQDVITFLEGKVRIDPRLSDFNIEFNGQNVCFNFLVENRGFAEVRGVAFFSEKKIILKEFGRYVV